ncbi:MAG: hypothetical protein GXX98_01360, partial [Planctomycetes bacterium]|jgi:hypothetical protein|nr:hypothetical protein [Planctomycetota bacterium]
VELNLRHKHDDGSTLYDACEVDRRLAARDDRLMRAAAELLDYVPDVGMAVEILHRAFFEMRLAWLQNRFNGNVVDVLHEAIARRLQQLVSLQRARGGADGPDELTVLARFEQTLVAALAERREQRRPKEADAVVPEPIRDAAATPSEPVAEAPARKEKQNRWVKSPKQGDSHV